MATASIWIVHSPKPQISSLSSFCIIETRRRTARKLLLLSNCSSSSSSSSSLHEESQSQSRVPPPSLSLVDLKKETTKEKVASSDSDLGCEVASETVIKKKRKRRRSPIVLWKRIFFASKKVRSIILLNILSVIYGILQSYHMMMRFINIVKIQKMRLVLQVIVVKLIVSHLKASDIPVLKEVEQIVDPALFTMVRFVVTALPFLPFMLQAREDCEIRTAGIELGFWVSLGCLCQALGLLTSEAGQASFISAFTMIVVPLIDGIFGATVPALTWAGALVSLIGVGILEYGGSPPCVGDILNIMSAVFFGVHILRTEQISRTIKKEKFLAFLGYQTSVVALSSALWFICTDMSNKVHQLNLLGSFEWSACWQWMISFPWIPAIYAGLFSTGLCMWVEMDAMRDVSATETAIIYGLEPVWGATFAWFLLGERWDTTEWIGAALVLCGSLTVQILGSSLEEPPKKNSSRNSSHTIATDNQNNFSLLTIVVKSGKNVSDLFKKQDKL